MFLLLPNQLFNNIDKNKKYILYEHPKLFTKYMYHVKKLILHRASMKAFYDRCVKNGINMQYVEYNDKINPKTITEMYDPCDKDIEKEFKHVTFHVSPMWLLTREQLDNYKGTLFFHSFKLFAIESLKLEGMDKSLDDMNRNKYDEKVYPSIPVPNMKDKQYIDEANKYIKIKCYGLSDNFEYPVTRETALVFMKDFFDKRLGKFGKYQDSIVENTDGNILYHSFLSSSLNIGIITVDEVLSMAYKYRKKYDKNSFEGYVRQLLWREYMRYIYHVHYTSVINSNKMELSKSLSKSWYSNNKFKTGILPVDVCLDKVVRTAYLHHIERLMIMLNIMVLMEIKPKDMYKWFMSCFIDAYDWVMLGNVFIFSYSHKGSRKPYISSSNYILKMSDYQRGDWCDKWDRLYHDFLKNKKDKLRGTIYFKK